MRHRRGSSLLVTAALAFAGAAAVAQPAAASNPFYCQTPGLNPSESFFTNANLGFTAAPGEISDCEVLAGSDTRFATGTRVWQLIYRSTDENGVPRATSGTVIVPPGQVNGLMSLATGTVGTRDAMGTKQSCAPSVGLVSGDAAISGEADDYLDRGYAVAVTDYQGLRTPGPHLYVDGFDEGAAMIDMARAARALPDAGLQNQKVVFAGFSQGGQATLWAAQLAATYGAGLPVVGAVAGASPVDLKAVLQNLDGALFSGLYAYAIPSMDQAYPELGLSSKLSSSGQSFLNSNQNLCSTELALSLSAPFRSWSNLWQTGKNPMNDPAFLARLAQNHVPTTTPTVKLFMYHGDNDGVVPFGPDKALADGWGAQPPVTGGPDPLVTWLTVPNGSHVYTTHTAGREASYDWVARRFAGQ